MAARDKEILEALLAKMYMVLNAGDPLNDSGIAGGGFVSYTPIGVPMSREAVSFGFGTTAKEVAAAAEFASLVNSIPYPTGFWKPTEEKVWDVYRMVMQGVQLPSSKLSADEEKRLKASLMLLYTETTVVDPETGELTKVPAETVVFANYKKYRAAYEQTLLQYNNLLINFKLHPDDPTVVVDWNINGPTYESRVHAAYDDWTANNKGKVETALATIDVLTGRDPARLWYEYQQQFQKSARKDTEGGTYWHTGFSPSDFASPANDASWTRFAFTHTEVHTIDTSTATSWGGGAGFGFGLWSFGASAQYSSEHHRFESDAENMSLSVELIKVPVRRTWWTPSIFRSRAWRFDPQVSKDLLSDGKVPPSGLMVGYVSSVIFARNLNLSMNLTSTKDASARSAFSSSASVSYGPFSLRGNYQTSSATSTHDFSSTENTIQCAGMQIIGFGVEMLPKCPNPDESLNWPQPFNGIKAFNASSMVGDNRSRIRVYL